MRILIESLGAIALLILAVSWFLDARAAIILKDENAGLKETLADYKQRFDVSPSESEYNEMYRQMGAQLAPYFPNHTFSFTSRVERIDGKVYMNVEFLGQPTVTILEKQN